MYVVSNVVLSTAAVYLPTYLRTKTFKEPKRHAYNARHNNTIIIIQQHRWSIRGEWLPNSNSSGTFVVQFNR